MFYGRGKCVGVGRHLPDTLAQSHSSLAVMEAGAVAADTEQRKRQKYAHLEASHIFTPVAVETFEVFGTDARVFPRHCSAHHSHYCGPPSSPVPHLKSGCCCPEGYCSYHSGGSGRWGNYLTLGAHAQRGLQ